MAQFVDRNKKAVALEYEPGDQAPKVIATGQGKLAERIIEVAQDANVPVHKDAKLAESLSILDIGEYIPPELYSIVAEVLVFVDSMDRIQSKMEKR
ncbi:MAG: EscU/YscU/HrcU family type III secretion system export apparatus switch protein [Eubacterium sp.]|nr:EscU/YscU/HrcU family type III secretion system export apparatus switch protein [Eubacterium sp.]